MKIDPDGTQSGRYLPAIKKPAPLATPSSHLGKEVEIESGNSIALSYSNGEKLQVKSSNIELVEYKDDHSGMD